MARRTFLAQLALFPANSESTRAQKASENHDEERVGAPTIRPEPHFLSRTDWSFRKPDTRKRPR